MTDTADHYAQVDVTLTTLANTQAGVTIRAKVGDLGAGNATDTGYYFTLEGNSGEYRIYELRNFVLVNNITASGQTTGSLYLWMSGSSYSCQRNGVTLLSGTNTTYTGGVGERKVGILGSAYTSDSDTASFNDFLAGDILPSTQAPRSMHQFRLRR